MTVTTSYSVVKLLILGLVFHLVFIFSVFDCYFTSPVVNGMESFNAGTPEAERLVLIIGDGLRADLLFQKNGFPRYPGAPQIVAPHLRSIAEQRGAFGISHTRVPTESRPGHVAIIGGMYEDVSAVTRGWKVNPVNFDSIFNQSSHTFAFGSPDIIPMFQQGATSGKVKGWTYNEEDEDFTKDATALDTWVLNNFKTLLKNATTDPVLDAELREDKVIIFLHLLGLDTTGHSYRPHSKEYMKNIQLVDRIVKETEELISEFYKDGLTSYIFTADHGMSVIGNHGDGNPDSTRTPFIAWGRGIRGPLTNPKPSSHDAYSKKWDMNGNYRRDLEQADITPLMATLLGVDWPVNCVGVLPDVDPRKPSFLAPRQGVKKIAQASLTNAKMILEHYRVKHELKKAKKFFYKPFPGLEKFAANTSVPIRVHDLEEIEKQVDVGNIFAARMKALSLIENGLRGIRYLETYERTLIRTIAALAYTGWAAYASLYVFRPLDLKAKIQSSDNPGFTTAVHSLSFLVFSVFSGMFALEGANWTYYLYIAFPCYFWDQFISQAGRPLLDALKQNQLGISSSSLLLRVALVVSALVSMVFGYLHRSIWSFGLVFMGFFWPQATWPQEARQKLGIQSSLWTLSCLVTAVFPFLEVNKEESVPVITAGGFTLAAVGALQAYRIAQRPGTNQSLKNLFILQLLLTVVMVFATRVSALSLQAKTGLPPLSQVLGWMVLLTSASIPFLAPVQHDSADSKFLMHFLGLGPLFIILSLSDEVFFFVSYSITLYLWTEVEKSLAETIRDSKGTTNLSTYQFKTDDVRIVLFFLFFVQVGFFGTGKSFYLAPVYRLIPVFHPFFMAVPLICKITAPYVMLSLAIASVTNSLKLPPFSLFLVALMLTDGMTLTFFFNVRDTGSWLEIGQTISFFVITSLLLLWSGGVCAAGEYLMSDVFSRSRVKNA
ncbi:gpi ethanolamine phosphate transferase 1 [Moniliophthora roreri MCA 2997]|uniref:GPI ethanolamine phosphate transferase 1 n=1 Tax=Moniliophthora roreri (strain MCA 2997) TaxID=1381753 RepID=V2XZT0_MONRO|nr:gpi ethanolamine phosphate transferase 1 [Moniliophthora roreri MCA 2997]